MSAVDRSAAMAARAAFLAALVMIAQQVGGKAARDAIYLSHFAVETLPAMIITASIISIVGALGTARLMTRRGPSRIVPVGFLLSAGLLVGEWAVMAVAPHVTAVALYLHLAMMGGVLISGFWSMVNERFDPRTAKRYVGRIAFGASVGGLAGGLLAERVAALVGVGAMLPVMAGMHVACAALVVPLRSRSAAPTPSKKADASEADDGEPPRSGLLVLFELPYLRNLALLLLLSSLAAGLADYVFKAAADAEFADGDELGRFFAGYYTGIGLLTLVFQAALARPALEKLGLARTVTTLPAAVIAAGVAAFAVPGLVTATVMRGADAVLRSSLFRAGYELLFTPVPKQDKRSTKTIIDVGVDKLGDAGGAGLVALLLLAGATVGRNLMIGLAIVLAGAAVFVALRLHRGYVKALERSLVNQAEALELDEVKDSTTRLTLLETLGTVDLASIREAARELRARREAAEQATAAEPAPASRPSTRRSPPTRPADPVVEQIAILRSRDAAKILATLRTKPGLAVEAVPVAIQLLAWDEVQRDVVRALRPLAPAVTGQLVDHLLDRKTDFAVRRRLPRILGGGDPARAAAGLIGGLSDRRFEVRYQCGRALSHIRGSHPDVVMNREQVLAVVRKALEVNRRVWDGQSLLDTVDPGGLLIDDTALDDRVNRSLEHVFTLLALVLPRQPVKIAFRGLHTDDPHLRGTAVEYLETALPGPIFERLRPFVEEGDRKPAAQAPTADAAEKLELLLQSRKSIDLNLDELRARLAAAQEGAES